MIEIFKAARRFAAGRARGHSRRKRSMLPRVFADFRGVWAEESPGIPEKPYFEGAGGEDFSIFKRAVAHLWMF